MIHLPAESPARDAADSYALLGLRVVPLCRPAGDSTRDDPKCRRHRDCGKSSGKRPLLANWAEDATTDPETIGRWFGRRDDLNVGVALGSASGVVALDIDGKGGERLVAELLGDLPETWAMRTGNGRRLLFRVPESLEADPKTAAFRTTCGGELRLQGTGAQCVMPPSLHYSGSHYEWEPGHSPDEIECAPMPPAVVALGTPQPRESDPLPARNRADYGPSDARLIEKRVMPYLSKLPASVAGQGGHSACFYAARVLVTGFKLSEADALAVLSQHFNTRCEPPWSQRELEHKVRQAANHPFGKPAGWLLDKERPAANPSASGAHQTNGAAQPRPQPQQVASAPPPPQADPGIVLETLMTHDFPPAVFAVEGLLTTGLVILAGPPKSGKSFLTYQVAIAVAGGYPCLGGRKVRQSPVLYLALEDTRRRLKARAASMLERTGWAPNRSLLLRVASAPASAGGLQAIGEWFADNPGGVVVIDTFQRFRDAKRGGESAYADDYAAFAAVKALADAHGGTALVLCHTTKDKSSGDPFSQISGTLAITGAADTILVLDRQGDGGKMWARGRDLEERTFTMDFDKGLWKVTGEVEGIELPDSGRSGGGAESAKAAECAAWLVAYLGKFAHPDDEAEVAAKAAGHTPNAWKGGKAILRGAEPRLSSKPAGKGGRWWIWMGPHRPIDRPACTNGGSAVGP